MTEVRDAVPTAAKIVDTLGALFAHDGAASYFGECVTMAEHMLQTAANAAAAGAADELIAAALLHDVGHLTLQSSEDALAQGIDARHEARGSRFLSAYFPAGATEPVRLHVDAKRYLCAIDPAYSEALTPASRHTLELQGGSMPAEEAQAFAALPGAAAAVALRRWDDAGKVANRSVPGFDHYRKLLQALIAA